VRKNEQFRPINRRKRLSPEERRAQIAQEGAKLITRYGSYGFPMQSLADAVGLTLPGLNHYVKSREDLLSLVIESFYDSSDNSIAADMQAADEKDDSQQKSLPQAMRDAVNRNEKRPNMVSLFMRLAIESEDPRHPAHEFYRDRHQSILTDMMGVNWNLPEEYRDPERLHDLIVTAFFAMDGVQIQSLTNPNEGMLQLWERAERVIFPSPMWDDYR
jgi:AcrR family transcriptional regulator